MAQCKYCHASLTRLDKEVCPFCGGKRPLDGTDTSTQDVTKIVDQLENTVEIKHKKRIIAALLAVFFGLLGAPLFYLGKIKKGFCVAAICLGFISSLGLLLFFVAHLHIWSFLIPYFVTEIYSLVSAYIYLTNHSVQDSHGEFLE